MLSFINVYSDFLLQKVIQMRSLAPDMSVKVAAEARNKAKIRNSTYLPGVLKIISHSDYITSCLPVLTSWISG